MTKLHECGLLLDRAHLDEAHHLVLCLGLDQEGLLEALFCLHVLRLLAAVVFLNDLEVRLCLVCLAFYVDKIFAQLGSGVSVASKIKFVLIVLVVRKGFREDCFFLWWLGFQLRL